MKLHKRKPSPDFSDEGLVKRSFSSYFLQHLPGQHFELPLQQSAANDVAGVAPMNAAKVAIRRRYFIESCLLVSLRNSATNFNRAEPTVRRVRRAAGE
jgi:hypothetical protein